MITHNEAKKEKRAFLCAAGTVCRGWKNGEECVRLGAGQLPWVDSASALGTYMRNTPMLYEHVRGTGFPVSIRKALSRARGSCPALAESDAGDTAGLGHVLLPSL